MIKQAGSLVYVSNVAFTFKSLRPTGTKLLTEIQASGAYTTDLQPSRFLSS